MFCNKLTVEHSTNSRKQNHFLHYFYQYKEGLITKKLKKKVIVSARPRLTEYIIYYFKK